MMVMMVDGDGFEFGYMLPLHEITTASVISIPLPSSRR